MRNFIGRLGLFPGVTVSIIADTGIVFIGQVRGWRDERHHDCEIVNENNAEFILLQLTAAAGVYTVGEIVAIKLDSIISIGPVIPT